MRALAPHTLLRRFARSDGGLAAIELGLALPFLALLLFGGYDVARFVGIRANVDKVGFSVADVTSQYEQLNAKAISEVFRITGSSLPTYVSGTNGVTVLTSVYLDKSNKSLVRWQCYSSAGTTWKSKIGIPGGSATIASDLIADQSDNIIISEVYYKFDPLFSVFFKTGIDLYTSSTYRPRLGTLTTSPC